MRDPKLAHILVNLHDTNQLKTYFLINFILFIL